MTAGAFMFFLELARLLAVGNLPVIPGKLRGFAPDFRVGSSYRTQLTLNVALCHIWNSNGPHSRY
ncbi:hypothetical protein BSK48_28525 [Paenibacillus odorifer]|uniref:hypothetical protein n=1 Tax=Paenibacillus odorifer TaxID=189426 RepID=UPI00096CF0A4|nr:hypothetical protein [Paenibacillus odorifer]OMD61330.1 hypothetical protein BSK48_28525 [Paenibacillus odorifer]OME06912.1 hypothetical protein BSK64_09410 [Paenibacillus odorifer]